MSIQMGRVGSVTIERMTTVGEDDNVIAGGSITLDGAPMVEGGLVIVDGAIELVGVPGATTSRTTTTTTTTTSRTGVAARGRTGVRVRAQGEGSARWSVGGGVVVVADRAGHRWRLRIQGGDLAVRTEGANPEGRAVWVPTDGALRVEVTAMGDARLALEGDAPSVAVSTGGNVVLSTQTMGALDELLRVAPAGSDDALRMAAAVQVALREAERSEPAFYNVPIRGRSIVLVVDVSYSMREPDPRAVDLSIAPGLTPTKLDVARAELVKVLGSLPADVAVNIVAFSSNVTTLWQNPRIMDRDGLSEAIRWIGALQPRDETEPVAALEAAAAMQPEQIVLLSDGRPTDRETIARALLGLADGVSSRMRLDVVGIGPDQDRTFLAALAARGRGELRMR
ncbi:MAG: VWA domain-containing protein [Deltaproteobacteria bacterium]|nr:VWA domain-containing protein [Deltaproteobacteria bacterium]